MLSGGLEAMIPCRLEIVTAPGASAQARGNGATDGMVGRSYALALPAAGGLPETGSMVEGDKKAAAWRVKCWGIGMVIVPFRPGDRIFSVLPSAG